MGAVVRMAAAVCLLSSCTPAGSGNEPAIPPAGGVFNVRTFGATGNGRSDDSSAIRAALAAAASHRGGRVYFPSGIYLIDPGPGPFVVNSDVSVAGSGPRSILRVRDGVAPYNLIFGQPAQRIRSVAFLNFRVDQNPAGNPQSNINPANDAEDVIQLYDFDGVTIKDVAFDPEPGIQAVVLAGPRASNATIDRCTFRFERGAASNKLYDNSSIYTESARVRVESNLFSSTNAQNAVTAIEVHGGPYIEVTNNEALEFQIAVNVVNSTKGYPDVAAAHVVIDQNRFLKTTQAFDLWSVTGRTLRDVVIRDNLVTMEQHRQYANTWLGVSFVRGPKAEGIDGAFDGVSVDKNIFDFRRLYVERIATLDAAGIDAAPKGGLHALKVFHNRIIASPASGLRIGTSSAQPELQHLNLSENTVSDAGWDRHAPALMRAAVIMAPAWLTDVHADRNVILDTGHFGDLRQAFSAWAHPLSASRNVTLRYDRIAPRGVMRYSVDDGIVDDRGTRP